jgi:L-fuconolactonase
MNRTDAHHHVWDLGRRPQSWLEAPGLESIRRDFSLNDLAPEVEAARVDRTVLVQVSPDVQETAEFLAMAAGSDLVAGVVGWADLTSDDLPHTLAHLRDGPGGDFLVGVRHLVQSEPDPGWLRHPDVRRGLRAVAEAGLVYDLLTLPHQLPAAVDTVRSLPELTFVLDHLSKPLIASGQLEPWAAQVRELAAEPNVFCKLSGMVTEAGPGWAVQSLQPYAETVLDAFGPRRVMFGSDWPVCLLTASYAEVAAAADELTAGLSADERADVFDRTAARAYGLAPRKDAS